jgi:hypothetical protein
MPIPIEFICSSILRTNMKIKFAFVRHGYGCHNSLRPLYNNRTIRKNSSVNLSFVDPELTELGVDASIRNGSIMNKVLSKVGDMRPITVVGCSPLIRCMETAYYMSRTWEFPPEKIYVFPLLREINESSKYKFSDESRLIMETTPSYMMKSIQEQKEYLNSLGILRFFDFSFVEDSASRQRMRKEPGDIELFTKWFAATFVPTQFGNISNVGKKLNVFITTHAGVLKSYAKQGFSNNSGFLLQTSLVNRVLTADTLVNLDEHLPTSFFRDYSSSKYASGEYMCPSKRCGEMCSIIDSKSLQRLESSSSSAKLNLKRL